MRSIILTSLILVLGLMTFTAVTPAQTPAKIDKQHAKQLKDAVDRVEKASRVVNSVMRISDRSIPRDLMAKAKAIVVFPGALKAAFIFGGQGGSGVVIKRMANGWSAPAFLNMGGGSFGAQIGGQKTDYILLIMNDKGLKGLLEDKFELGGEGSVAAGPVGRSASASTNVTLDAEILSYSRTKGLFAGIALKGVVIAPDKDMNLAIYEKTAKEILGEPAMPASDAPGSLQVLGQTVSNYVK